MKYVRHAVDPLTVRPDAPGPRQGGDSALPSCNESLHHTVRVATTEDEFDALEPDWTRLHEAFGTTPFQSFTWLRTWWRHYGETDPTSRLHLMVVSCDGLITAIAPFFEQRVSLLGVVPVRRLLVLGRDTSGYLDLVIDEAHEVAGLRAIATALSRRRGEFDVLRLERLPDWSPSTDGLIRALRECGLRVDKSVADRCPRFRFAETWDETLALLPPATRGKMRRRQRQLATRHAAEVEFVADLARVGTDFDEFVALHQHRWRSVGQPGVFAEEGLYGFFRDVTGAMAAEGRFVLAFLRLDGCRRSAVMGVRHRDEFHFILSGQGEAGEASRYSPGLALHLWCMEALHGQGVRVYDFLPGVEPYKADLGGVVSPSWTVTVAGRPGGLGIWPYRAYRQQAKVTRRLALEKQVLQANGERVTAITLTRHLATLARRKLDRRLGRATQP